MKSVEILEGIVNQIINEFDILQVLRSFRNEIKNHSSFNNFNQKRVNYF